MRYFNWDVTTLSSHNFINDHKKYRNNHNRKPGALLKEEEFIIP